MFKSPNRRHHTNHQHPQVPTLPLASISQDASESLDTLLQLLDSIPYEHRHAYIRVPQLSQPLKDSLVTIEMEYQAIQLKIKALGAKEQDLLELKRAWFETFFDFLFNHANELSPRLFVYFNQHEWISPQLISWMDALKPEEISRVHDKFFELVGKIDSPGRIEAFYEAPKALLLNAVHAKDFREAIPTPRALTESGVTLESSRLSKVPRSTSI